MSSRIRMSRTDVLIRLSYSTRFFELSTAFKSMSTSSLESELVLMMCQAHILGVTNVHVQLLSVVHKLFAVLLLFREGCVVVALVVGVWLCLELGVHFVSVEASPLLIHLIHDLLLTSR